MNSFEKTATPNFIKSAQLRDPASVYETATRDLEAEIESLSEKCRWLHNHLSAYMSGDIADATDDSVKSIAASSDALENVHRMIRKTVAIKALLNNLTDRLVI